MHIHKLTQQRSSLDCAALWSHTVITESAIHRNFDVQYIEDILQNVSTLSINVKNEPRKPNIEN